MEEHVTASVGWLLNFGRVINLIINNPLVGF
jgi:hypothetical protein